MSDITHNILQIDLWIDSTIMDRGLKVKFVDPLRLIHPFIAIVLASLSNEGLLLT